MTMNIQRMPKTCVVSLIGYCCLSMNVLAMHELSPGRTTDRKEAKGSEVFDDYERLDDRETQLRSTKKSVRDLRAHERSRGDDNVDADLQAQQKKEAGEWEQVKKIKTFWLTKSDHVTRLAQAPNSPDLFAQIGRNEIVVLDSHAGSRISSFFTGNGDDNYLWSIAPVSHDMIMTSGIYRVLWNRKGKRLLTLNDDACIELRSGKISGNDVGAEIVSLPNGLLISGSGGHDGNTLKWWRLPIDRYGNFDGDDEVELIRKEELSEGRVSGLGSLSYHHFASLFAKGSIAVWDVESGKKIQTFNGASQSARLTVANDGRCASAGGEEAQIWDLRTPLFAVHRMSYASPPLSQRIALHDNQLILSPISLEDTEPAVPIQIFDVRTGKLLQQLQHDHARGLLCLVNGMLATGGADGCVKLWQQKQ